MMYLMYLLLVWLLLPSGLWAFPTTAVLDNFNRADENPLGNGNWSGSIISTDGSARYQILSNQAAPTDTANDQNYWSAGTFGPDCEAYLTIATNALSAQILYARLVDPAVVDATDGYRIYIDGSTWYIQKITNMSASTLGASFSQSISNGDAIGIEVTGTSTTTVKAFYKASGGGWTEIASRTDSSSPHTSAGYIGFTTNSSTGLRLDDFGGGTIIAGGSGGSNLMMMGVGR